MNKELTPQQALTNLYVAARQAKLTADEHKVIEGSASVLNSIINPKEESKKEE